MSRNFSSTTKKIAAKMAAERCTICQCQTSEPNSSRDDFVNLGQAAHIIGDNYAPNNRFDPDAEDETVKNLFNCIWLCSTCHKKIDSDQVLYTVDYLHSLKEKHFQRVVNGEYGISKFKQFDSLNQQIDDLRKSIRDKEKLIDQSQSLFNREVNQFNIRIHDLVKERDKLKENYLQLIEQTKDSEIDEIEEILRLVYEDNNFEKALSLLQEKELVEDQVKLAKKWRIRGRILTMQGKWKESYLAYKKAFQICNRAEFAFDLLAFLTRTENKKEKIQILKDTIQAEESANGNKKDLEALKLNLANTLSYVSPGESHKYYKDCLELNEEIRQGIDQTIHKGGYLNYLSISYRQQGKFEEALKIANSALDEIWLLDCPKELNEKYLGELASLFNNIAHIYNESGFRKYSMQYYKLALKIGEKGNKSAYYHIALNYVSNDTKENVSPNLILLSEITLEIEELFGSNPLNYAELLIGCYLKAYDLLMDTSRTIEAVGKLNKAETLLNNLPSIDNGGFRLLKSQILSRQFHQSLITQRFENGSRYIEELIQKLKDDGSTDLENAQRLAAAIIAQCKFGKDNSQKVRNIQFAIQLLEPMQSKYGSVGEILSTLKIAQKSISIE